MPIVYQRLPIESEINPGALLVTPMGKPGFDDFIVRGHQFIDAASAGRFV
jgi:hypothetical protein